jgi:hypothetical protein
MAALYQIRIVPLKAFINTENTLKRPYGTIIAQIQKTKRVTEARKKDFFQK